MNHGSKCHPEWALIISRSVKHGIEQFDVIFLFLRNLFQKYLRMTCKSHHWRLNSWWCDDQRLKGLRCLHQYALQRSSSFNIKYYIILSLKSKNMKNKEAENTSYQIQKYPSSSRVFNKPNITLISALKSLRQHFITTTEAINIIPSITTEAINIIPSITHIQYILLNNYKANYHFQVSALDCNMFESWLNQLVLPTNDSFYDCN